MRVCCIGYSANVSGNVNVVALFHIPNKQSRIVYLHPQHGNAAEQTAK